MQGYWKDAKRTDEAMERHPDEPDILWMRTGDIAIMDEEGYVRIVGRSKDVIIRGGE
jgi:acyl-CoA synthetase (AMP-forming)/AMP-acid ligase II